MDDVKKMFRTIVNGQSAMKQELLKKIEDLDKKVEKGFKNVNERLDKQGKSLAYLEDDAPTREEHDELEERVTNIEGKVLQV